MMHPIPDSALDDRLGFVGISGSGKTFGAGTAVERLLKEGHRAIICDPLSGWWGLRMKADGDTPSGLDVVIFGGEHGDLPLTEHAGALIGEAAATMKESAIIDTSGLGTKAGERRFMLNFLTALYRKASGEPVHLVFDEADLWAPQQVRDKTGGEAPKLLGMMESVVRRGRIRGFVPWLISQRPAVINKDVLSQVDGLVAFKLTGAQDRKALGEWVRGQADEGEWKRIWAEIATLPVGKAVVWLPGRGVLKTAAFPMKETFDSSATPKRGEKKRHVELKPLDLGTLKEKLAKVEEEIKANDPKALKAEVFKLKRELAKRPQEAVEKVVEVADPKAVEAAEKRGREYGYDQGFEAGYSFVMDAIQTAVEKISLPQKARPPKEIMDAPLQSPQSKSVRSIAQVQRRTIPPPPPPDPDQGATGELTRPQLRVLKALAWWKAMRHERVMRAQVGFVSGYKHTSGGFNNLLGSLRTAGMIDYPEPGKVCLTEVGEKTAPSPDVETTLLDSINAILTNPQRKIVNALVEYGETMTREQLGEATEYRHTSGGFNNLLGSLRTLEIVYYPAPGQVALREWVMEGL